jgi:hypothetical protein
MVMIALQTVLGGAFSRLGYGRRIAFGLAGAVGLRVAEFGALLAGQGDPWINLFQYLVPVSVIAGISVVHFKGLTNGELAAHLRRGVNLIWTRAPLLASEIAAGAREFPQLVRDRGRLAGQGRSRLLNPSGRRTRIRKWIS